MDIGDVNMGRSCYICNSVHRAEYDKMRLEGMPIKSIWIYAQNIGEKQLLYHHFQKHFANHVEVLVNEQVKANKLREKFVKETIKKDMEVVQRMSSNLNMIGSKIDDYANKLDNPINEEMFLRFVAESRMIIEQYLKWASKLNLEDTSEDLMKKIMYCMRDFPPDLVGKFVEEWKEYDISKS